GHAREGRQDRRARDREGQSGDRAHARPRPLAEGADGSLPQLRADDEPDQRRREVHGPGRRSPRSTARGDAEKGAGDVIDAGGAVDERCSLNSHATSSPSMTTFSIVSLGLKSVNALSNSFASSAMPGSDRFL